MKVRTLLEKLEKANPDQEIVITPMKEFAGIDDAHPERVVADPFTRFSIAFVGEIGNMEGERFNYTVLAFDQLSPVPDDELRSLSIDRVH